MALITREAIQNEDFVKIFSTVEYVIPPTNKQSESRNIGAGNKLVFDFTDYYYPEVIGAKSGYTIEAGHTLVSVAQKDGRTLICVVLAEQSSREMYQDTVALLDYGFSGFTQTTLTTRTAGGLGSRQTTLRWTGMRPSVCCWANGVSAEDPRRAVSGGRERPGRDDHRGDGLAAAGERRAVSGGRQYPAAVYPAGG